MIGTAARPLLFTPPGLAVGLLATLLIWISFAEAGVAALPFVALYAIVLFFMLVWRVH